MLPTNSTSAVATETAQNATGQTLLWAIITLALTAATQDSVTARYFAFAGARTESHISPYRVSPIFCFWDTIIELYAIYTHALELFKRSLRATATADASSVEQNHDISQPEQASARSTAVHMDSQSQARMPVPSRGEPANTQAHTAHEPQHDVTLEQYVDKLYHYMESERFTFRVPTTKEAILNRIERYNAWNGNEKNCDSGSVSNAVSCMKLAMFVLGALPQAVKIFSIKGIPETQVLAAIYLSAVVVHSFASYLPHELLEHEAPAMQDETWHWLKIASFAQQHILIYGYPWMEYKGKLLKPSSTLLFVCQVLYELSLRWNIIRTGITWMIPFLPLPPMVCLHLVSGMTWFYIMQSVLYFFTDLAQQTARLTPRGSWQFWAELVDLKTGSAYLPLLAVPIAVCIAVAQLACWCAKLLPIEEQSNEVTVGKRTFQVNDILELLKQMRQARPKLASAESTAWLPYWERVRTLATVMVLTVLIPFPMIWRLSYWYSTLDTNVHWLVYLMFNIGTMTMWYTQLYDGSSTSQPSWTAILG